MIGKKGVTFWELVNKWEGGFGKRKRILVN